MVKLLSISKSIFLWKLKWTVMHTIDTYKLKQLFYNYRGNIALYYLLYLQIKNMLSRCIICFYITQQYYIECAQQRN
jgi:hypothetical protein